MKAEVPAAIPQTEKEVRDRRRGGRRGPGSSHIDKAHIFPP